MNIQVSSRSKEAKAIIEKLKIYESKQKSVGKEFEKLKQDILQTGV